MAEKVKVVSDLGDVMFEAILPDKYIHLLTMKDNKIKRYVKNTKRVPIGTGNAGNALEYETVYEGYQVSWQDLRSLADEDAI